MNLLTKMMLGIAVCLVLTAKAGYVTWDYASKIDVVMNEINVGGGWFTYDFALTNNDDQDIWFAGIYSYNLEPQKRYSDLLSWNNNAYTEFTVDNGSYNIQALGGDSWFAGYHNSDYPQRADLAVGATAHVGFSTMGQITRDVYYGYWVKDKYVDNHYTAVGIARKGGSTNVPEPATLFLLSFGIMAIGGCRFVRKK